MLFRAQALLVDIDGTLVDSTAAVIASWTTWAAAHRLDVREILRVCHGRRAQDTVAMFLPAERVPSATRQLVSLPFRGLASCCGTCPRTGGLASHRARRR